MSSTRRKQDGERRIDHGNVEVERMPSTATFPWGNLLGTLFLLTIISLPVIAIYDMTGPREVVSSGTVTRVAHSEESTKVLMDDGFQVRFRGVQPIGDGDQITITARVGRITGEYAILRWHPAPGESP